MCPTVDVQDEYAGQLNADFDFVDTCRKVSLSASFRNMFDNFLGPVLMHLLLLGVHLQLHGLLLECLLQDLQNSSFTSKRSRAWGLHIQRSG